MGWNLQTSNQAIVHKVSTENLKKTKEHSSFGTDNASFFRDGKPSYPKLKSLFPWHPNPSHRLALTSLLLGKYRHRNRFLLSFLPNLWGSLGSTWPLTVTLWEETDMVHSCLHALVTREDHIGVLPPRVYMRELQKPSGHGTWFLFSVNNECESIEFYKSTQYFLTTSQVAHLKIYLPLCHLEFTLKSGFMPHGYLSAKTNSSCFLHTWNQNSERSQYKAIPNTEHLGTSIQHKGKWCSRVTFFTLVVEILDKQN